VEQNAADTADTAASATLSLLGWKRRHIAGDDSKIAADTAAATAARV